MITSLISMKGGTAKTTTAVNLAAYLALSGLKVLLVDLDPHSYATVCFSVNDHFSGASMADVLLDDCSVTEATHATNVSGLHLAPADRRLASSDVLLADTTGRERLLKEKLEAVRSRYDHILIDNPPSLNLLTINSLVASDNYVITVSPSFLSVVGLDALQETVDVVRTNMGARVELLGILPTMVDSRLKVTMEVLDSIRQRFGDTVFKTSIRQNVRLMEAPSRGKTIFEYDSGSVGALCYVQFGREFLARCQRAIKPVVRLAAHG
ncbi:MAG: ParA family protein [Acidobacteriota bacterium]